MLEKRNAILNFPVFVIFTCEAQFTRDGMVSFHNQHVWAEEHPRALVISERLLVNILAGVVGDRTSWTSEQVYR